MLLILLSHEKRQKLPWPIVMGSKFHLIGSHIHACLRHRMSLNYKQDSPRCGDQNMGTLLDKKYISLRWSMGWLHHSQWLPYPCSPYKWPLILQKRFQSKSSYHFSNLFVDRDLSTNTSSTQQSKSNQRNILCICPYQHRSIGFLDI